MLQEVTREEAEEYIRNGGAAFYVMDKSGDTKTIWDPNKPDEVEIANDTFERLIEKGYSAFYVGDDHKTAEKMESFDAKAGKVIFTAPMVGG
jgi:hypothetical protein